ncbi:hypothetical protein [Isobaculum melis]|uniref:Uncharacterized protein n=1 Tax=Isobaculum melis TaxID=142588 RepID=A0A1H9Q307_9LACT|nr:hypothetical protein [Isobaculum melis]SER54847.1 hypothetical protein SAMN04488559_101318 [Isobaculum melis]
MNMKKYISKKIIKDFVIINVIINGIFYIIGFKNFSGQLTFNDITTDLFIGLMLLGAAGSWIGFVNMRKELQKGKTDVSNFQKSHFYHLLPKATGLRILFLMAITALITLIFFILLPSLLGLDKINHVIGFGFKTITAGLMACVIGYIVIDLSISDYQHQPMPTKDTTVV